MFKKAHRRPSGEQDTPHSIMLFSTHSTEVAQILEDVRGKHKRIQSLKFINSVIRFERSEIRGPVALLKLASFEDPQVSDSTIFREIGLDIQEYIKRYFDPRIQRSCSAIYLHLDHGTTPSLIAQRNFRAVHQLCQMLGLRDFSLFIMSTSSQESSSRSNMLDRPLFGATEDLNLWKECLAFQTIQPINQLVRLSLERRRGPPYTGIDQPLTKDNLNACFRQVESSFFAGVQAARASLVGEMDRARQDCQKAEDAAQAAEKMLHDISSQHNTLLQRMNIRDNTEISDVVHQFRGLNDDIDGFSLEVAQIIPKECFERHPSCINCYNPDGLRRFLNQPGSPLLLLESRTGAPMMTRQFLELFTAAVICWILCAHIFQPFYPLSPSDTKGFASFDTFTAVYNELRLQHQQMASAKWRIETYSSLLKLDSMQDRRVADISAHAAAMINSASTHLFNVEITDLATRTRLVKLVSRAIRLNHTIKAEVAHAGDIHTRYIHYNDEYDGSWMEVLDAKKGDPVPKHIVSMYGLGVYLTKAVGGGKEPESTVLLKAVVSSEDIYS
ncbi:hypothetical protein FRC08_004615 [Ceratobasidium sp. 394]|nr:hypothetical protein FRC08_004615 [Ceratobasidium sp. 394]